MRIVAKLIKTIRGTPLFRNAIVYAFSNVIGKAIPFLLLPIMTHYLTPADYGYVAMFMLVSTILEPIVAISLSGAVGVKYFDKEVDLPAYISSGVAVALAVALPVGVLLVLFRGVIGAVITVPKNWVPLVILLVVTRMFTTLTLTLWQVQEKPIKYGILQNLQSLAIISASLLLVVALEKHWEGRIAAELGAICLFGAASALYLWRAGWLKRVFRRDYARNFLAFGVPLIPHALGGVIMSQTDRLFVTKMVSVDATGLYTVAYQLATLIELIAVSFNSAYSPWLFKKLVDADDARKARLVRFTYLQFAGMTALSLLVAVAMPFFITHFLDPKFAESATYIRWFTIGFAFQGFYYMVANYIFYAERTAWIAAVTATTTVLNIPLCYLLIRENGAVGAVQATSIAQILTFFLTWFVSARAYPMPWFSAFSKASRRP